MPVVDRIPPQIFGLVVALSDEESGATDQQLFEVALTILMRWARVLWDEEFEEGREELWKCAEVGLGMRGGGRVLREMGGKGVRMEVSERLGPGDEKRAHLTDRPRVRRAEGLW